MRLLVLAVVMGGCGAKGLPVPDAMAIVWEGQYGMETANRPQVAWHDDCRADDGVGRNRSVSIANGCVVAEVFADGTIDLQSNPLVSDSAFVLALAQWKAWLVAADFSRANGHEEQAAKIQLIDAGL